MKYHFEISHLTKFHAFRMNGDQVIDFVTWFKTGAIRLRLLAVQNGYSNFSNVETRVQTRLAGQKRDQSGLSGTGRSLDPVFTLR